MKLKLPVNGKLTDGFGPRGAVPGVPNTGNFHTGQDIAAPAGTPIFAAAPGVVTRRWYEAMGGYMVEVDHGNGHVTRYAHMQGWGHAPGFRVTDSTVIGQVGSTGSANGSHAHFEYLINGKFVDPMKYLGNNTEENEEMIVTIQGKGGVRAGGAYLLKDGVATFLGTGTDVKGAPHIVDGPVLRALAKHYKGINV